MQGDGSREAFEPRNWEETQVVRQAIRWHLLGIDGPKVDDGAWDHGWSREERTKIDDILCDRGVLEKVLLAWRDAVGKQYKGQRGEDVAAVVRSLLFRRFFTKP